jgi:hypothetical protein
MPRTVREEIAIEQRGVKGTADKRGSNEVYSFETEHPNAQAQILRMFPYMREKHPEIARSLGYNV